MTDRVGSSRDLRDAIRNLEREVEWGRRQSGPDHQVTLRAMARLAEAQFTAGKLPASRSLRQRVLDARRRSLGASDLTTLQAMNELAATIYAMGDLREARDLLEKVLSTRRSVLGEEHPDTLRARHDLATVLLDEGDISRAHRLALSVVEASESVLGENDPNALRAKQTLASVLTAKGEVARAGALMIEVQASMRRIFGENHPATLDATDQLAVLLDLNDRGAEAKSLLTHALEVRRRLLGEDHPDTALATMNLAVVLLRQGEIATARELIERAVAIYPHSLGSEHPQTMAAIANLAQVKQVQGELDDARRLEEKVLRWTQERLGADHPQCLHAANNLAGTLQELGELAEARAIFEKTLASARRVLGDGHPATQSVAGNLASVLLTLGDLAGAQRLEEELIQHRSGAQDTPSHRLLTEHRRAELLESQGDLDIALGLRRSVLDGCVAFYGETHWHTISAMNGLAKLHHLRGERETAHQLQERVLDADRRLFGAEHSRTLTDMGNLASSFQAQRNLAAAQDFQERVLTTSRRRLGADHSDTLRAMSNLAQTLYERGDLDRSKRLLEEARESSLRTLGANHPDSLRIAGNLAVVLQVLGNLTKARRLQEEALTAYRSMWRDDHPDTRKAMGNLAVTLQATGGRADLESAIGLLQRAVAATPSDHPDATTFLANLGQAHLERHAFTAEPSDLEQAMRAFREASGVRLGVVRTRIAAARVWGMVAASLNRWDEAAEGLAVGVGLLPLVAGRQLWRGDQERELSQFAGLVSDAAACSLQRGDAGRAVELLEQGRGILLAQTLEARSDLSELWEAEPALAGRFEQLRDELDTEQAPLAGDPSFPDGAWNRTAHPLDWKPRLARELEHLLADIRNRPGLRGFLMPPSLQDLLAEAAEGPVVMINVSQYRSDALIVTPDGVRPLSLRELTLQTVAGRANDFLEATHAVFNDDSPVRAAAAATVIQDVIRWLWESVARPVLEEIGLTREREQDERWPRIWWSPTGFLNFLPLHAAGDHGSPDEPRSETVIDRAVSSYTPTLRALRHVRSKQRDRKPDGRLLAVAMPLTPGHDHLPETLEEVAMLAQRFPRIKHLPGEGQSVTRAGLLAELPASAWAHFACHAESYLERPSDSQLLTEGEPLTILDVSRLNLKEAEFAFLSACSTAQGGVSLPDEAIHMVSAFQLAGYTHVIGTLWPVADHVARRVADDVYAALGADGGDRLPDARGAAIALHDSVRAVRHGARSEPHLWASHIHAGP